MTETFMVITAHSPQTLHACPCDAAVLHSSCGVRAYAAPDKKKETTETKNKVLNNLKSILFSFIKG
jgi:hypothetical protein